MTGLILSGGESRRMGKDKGLLLRSGKSWVETTTDIFRSVSLPFVVSVNPAQERHYQSTLAGYKLLPDNPAIAVKGPLTGVLSAHKALPADDFLVLACDMIDMHVLVVQKLLEQYQQNNSFDAWVFKTEGEMQPLCAIYTNNALAKIMEMLQNGKLYKFSMKYMLENLNICVLTAPVEWLSYFKNYNAPGD